jgi:type IV pilus assembly protein PilP
MALNQVRTGVMVAALVAASTVVWAQGAPTPPPAAPPPAAAPQPAAPGAPAAAATPAVDPYSYDPAGRRDPFISLMARGVEPTAGRKVTGLAGMLTGELMLRGVLRSQGAYVALVAGPDGKTYTAHANDRLLDGIIRNVTPQGLVIMQEVNDPLSLVKQREVRKGLRAAEDGK